jgi:hypothetical protein
MQVYVGFTVRNAKTENLLWSLTLLKVHKCENFLGADFEFSISYSYLCLNIEVLLKKVLIGPVLREVQLFCVY